MAGQMKDFFLLITLRIKLRNFQFKNTSLNYKIGLKLIFCLTVKIYVDSLKNTAYQLKLKLLNFVRNCWLDNWAAKFSTMI